MQKFESNQSDLSRADILRSDIKALQNNKIANTSDAKFAAEIQEEIELREAELRELETRH
ncbi:MAG: hypothetical protein AAB618_01725 [Patescibacteria group bacterium]